MTYIVTKYTPENIVAVEDGAYHPMTPPKGQPMPQTVEYYEKLAIADLNLIMQQKEKIERLTQKNNQLRQKINQQKGG